MSETYILNPDEEEIFLYGIDEEGGNLPMHLSKGPYYESLEAIPIESILRMRKWKKESAERDRKRSENQMASQQTFSQPIQQFSPRSTPIPPPSHFNIHEYNATVSPRVLLPSPERQFNPPSPRNMEFGLTPGQQAVRDFQTSAFPSDDEPVYIRKWKVIRAVEMRTTSDRNMNDQGRTDEFCENIIRHSEWYNGVTSFLNEQNNEIILCNPNQVLEEYMGLFKIYRTFGSIRSKQSAIDPNTLDLYAGNKPIGTFEKPNRILAIPGRFNDLPGDVKMKIASMLEPDDLVKFCNISADNRRLCQNPSRSVWISKLLQLNPNLPVNRIRDPFRYFMQYYYGGTLLTFGHTYAGELGRYTVQARTFASLAPGQTDNNDGSGNYDSSRYLDMTPRPIMIPNVVDVSASSSRTIVTTTKGEVFILGPEFVNTMVQTIPFQSDPMKTTTRYENNAAIFRIGTVKNAIKTSVGAAHLAVLTKTGQVLTFGGNSNGQLGRPNTKNVPYDPRMSPPLRRLQEQSLADYNQVPGIETAVDVACGHFHTVILLNNGKIVAFGDNRSGQLGRETPRKEIPLPWNPNLMDIESYDYNPLVVDGVSDVVKIACGHSHTVAVLADGKVVSFGNNTKGQLGRFTEYGVNQHRETMFKDDFSPQVIPEFRTAVDVACGNDFSAVLLNDGRVATFGNNSHLQLGRDIEFRNDDSEERHHQLYRPAVIPNVSTAVNISCGDETMLITLKNGTVLQYGEDFEKGRQQKRPSIKPKVIRNVTGAIMTASGNHHAAILVMRRGW